MKTLEIGTQKYTKVEVVDEKGQGNANHEYCITEVVPPKKVGGILCSVSFQNGPVKEYGVNGVHNEDLIAIVIDRLQGFQSGDFACRDNTLALIKLEEALMWLRRRTEGREARGVEGTNKV